MKRLTPSRLAAVPSKRRPNSGRWLTPLRAVPPDRICEDVYPGGFRSTLAGRIYPAPKIVPFPGALGAGIIEAGSIEARVNHALRSAPAAFSLCAMLFFAPPVDHFAALRLLKKPATESAS